MCDYSLAHVKSRPAFVDDKIIVRGGGLGTNGFFAPSEGEPVAVCMLPGTEVAFEKPITYYHNYIPQETTFTTAIFRQINKEFPLMHHDALELPDGTNVLLTNLFVDQCATVLQLPAAPRDPVEAAEQERLPIHENTSVYGY